MSFNTVIADDPLIVHIKDCTITNNAQSGIKAYRHLTSDIIDTRYMEWIFPDDDTTKEMILIETRRIFVLIPNTDIVVGSLEVFQSGSDNKYFISDFSIYEEDRGHGYGDRLFSFVIQRFAIDEIDVYEDNVVAVSLYRKYGFDFITEPEKEKIGIMRRNV